MRYVVTIQLEIETPLREPLQEHLRDEFQKELAGNIRARCYAMFETSYRVVGVIVGGFRK